MSSRVGPPAKSYPAPIAERTKAILAVFNTILDTRSVDEEKLSAVVDNLSRFRIWAGNIGAYHVDLRSVDVRLRDAPEVAQRVLELLDELAEVNEEIRAITSCERQDAADEEYSDDEIGQDSEPVCELTELCLSASDTITSLLKVSALLRRATGRDRYAKAAAAQDHKFLEHFDIQHVAEKFPKVEARPWLRDRLGRANVQRRQYLRYARKHHDRMAHDPQLADEITFAQPKQENALKVAVAQSKTAASSHPTLAPTKASTFDHERLPNLGVTIEQIALLDDNASQATSVVTSSGHEDGAIDVVQLSELAKDGEPFECPYCWTIVQTRRQRSWRRHVMRDIRAWTCTFEDCSSGLFEDRDSWFQHELEHHRRQWTCHECTNTVFTSEHAIEAHIQAVHPTLPVEALPTIIDSSSRPVTEIQASACPLCDEWYEGLISKATELGLSTTHVMVPLHDFRRHLGHHLEQLALFAIPPNLANTMASGSHNNQHGTSSTGDAKDITDWNKEIDPNEARNEGVTGIALVLQDYEPPYEREDLRLTMGQTVIVSHRHEDGWLVASNPETGEYGLVPEHCLQLSHDPRRDHERLEESRTEYGTSSQIPQGIVEQEHDMRVKLETNVSELGRIHPNTLACMESLAVLLMRQGRLIEAAELVQEVIEARQTDLAPNHPSILRSMASLAWICREQGRLIQAEELAVRVLEGRKWTLGTDHPDTLISMDELAFIYEDQGKLIEARNLLLEVVDRWKVLLGTRHPSTLESMSHLASMFRELGCWTRAEELELEVIDVKKDMLGTGHTDTLDSLAGLALTYEGQGRLEEAARLEEEIEMMRQRRPVGCHIDNRNSTADLAHLSTGERRKEEGKDTRPPEVEIKEDKRTGRMNDDLVY